MADALSEALGMTLNHPRPRNCYLSLTFPFNVLFRKAGEPKQENA
jgi:hypothetical protein